MTESRFLWAGKDLRSRSGAAPLCSRAQPDTSNTQRKVCLSVGSFLLRVDCSKVLPHNEQACSSAYYFYWFQFCILDKSIKSHLPHYLGHLSQFSIYLCDLLLWLLSLLDVCTLTAELCLVLLTVIFLAPSQC